MRERKGGWKVGEGRNKDAVPDGRVEEKEWRAKSKND